MSAATEAPDPRPLYDRASAQLARLIAAVRGDQLARPTPCTEYDVRDLLGHVVSWARRVASVGEGGSAEGADVPDWAADLPAERWPELYEEARARVGTAWTDDAGLDAVVTMPFGQMPGRVALMATVMETVTHTWDLARAIDWEGGLDEDLARVALGVAHQALPAEGRENAPFGEVVETPASADAYTRLAAYLGRDPEWSKPATGR